jgi:hypothetical protein
LEVKFASDIETASGYLKGKIEESVWVKKQAERDSLYSRIVKSQDKIFDFIRDKLEVTEDGVLGRLFGGASLSRNQDIPSGALLRRLRAIKPISIDRELFGMFRDMGYDDENTITIWVSAELDVLIDIPLEPFSFFGPAQQVNAGEVDFSKVSRFSFPGKYEQKSLKIDRKVSVKLRVDPDTNTPIEILSATLP